jgi:DNA-binding transcriptional ArsR family regulator
MIPDQLAFGARLFAALANPARLRILEQLTSGAASVNEIAEAAELKQSITSQHLAALLSAGVVVYTRNGNQRIYRLRGPRIARILKLVEEFYRVHLDSLREVLARYPAAEDSESEAATPESRAVGRVLAPPGHRR